MNKNPPTTAAMLKDLVVLVCHPGSDLGAKSQAITIAYEIGRSEGRLEGAKSMGDHLLASVGKIGTERAPR